MIINGAKKKLTIGFIILGGAVLGYSLSIKAFTSYKDWERKSSLEHTERLNALRDMNFEILIDDNEQLFESDSERERDEKLDEVLKLVYEVSADTGGWKYDGQIVEEFAKTGNSHAPFVATVLTLFEHPEEWYILRMHTKTWIYVVGRGWMPMVEDVIHYGAKEGVPSRSFNKANVWDGDYEN